MKFIKKFNLLLISALLTSIVLAVFSQAAFWRAGFSLLALFSLALLATNLKKIHFQPRSELFRWIIFWLGLIIGSLSWALFLSAIVMLIFKSSDPLTGLLVKNCWLFLATCLIVTTATLYYGMTVADAE